MTRPTRFLSGPVRLVVVAAMAAATGLAIPHAQAGFMLGDAANFAVLYEGNGGNTLNFNNSNITGNIGIGATGGWADSGGCSGQCQIMGVVEFSAANSGQFSSSTGTTYTPALAAGVNPLYGQANVQTDLNTLNSLSQTLGGETGNSLNISSGGSVNASSGNLVNGDEVFTLDAASNFPNGTFTINGDGSGTQTVVVNVPEANGFAFNGSIVLTGGLTSDQVLFNFDSGNYTTLSGGGTLTINTNGATTTGTFLDPNGAFQINHSVLDGRIFGGDTQNASIVSGANIFAPKRIPEPGSLVLLGAGLAALGIIRRRYRPVARS